MWIKLCGVQEVERAVQLAKLDVEALGINRYEPSSRYVDRDQAVSLARKIRSVDNSLDLVGVYVNPAEEFIKRDHSAIQWDVLQLHGDESPRTVRRTGRLGRVIKAFSVDEDFSKDRLEPYDSWAFMLDAYHPEQYGGTGRTIPWNRVKTLMESRRVILSGGLTPENVREAIEVTRPFGVDVCSGIEDDKGLRDLDRSRLFVRNAREAVSEQTQS